MPAFIFDVEGRACGFCLGDFIYRLSGEPVGQVCGERAYTLDGRHVGAVYKNMIVEKPGYRISNRPPLAIPVPHETPRFCGIRSKALGNPYADVSHLLFEVSGNAAPTNTRAVFDQDDFFGDGSN